jgi:clan AA aspartic protease (TIGR02281 family)
MSVLLGCNPGKSTSAGAAAPPAATPIAQATPQPTPTLAATGDTVHTEVPVQESGGAYTVPVMINGVLSLDFMIDSGASDVVIPADVAGTLVRSGTLTRDDLIGDRTFVLANGEEVPSAEFRLKTLKVGTLILHDVVASVSDSKGSLLLGQTFLSRLSSWSFDNSRHVLVLKAAGPGVQAGVAETPASPSQTEEASNADAPGLTPELAASRAVAYLATWSSPWDPNGDSIRGYYAPVVNFYGTATSLDDLMEQKHAFAARWPARRYVVRPDTVASQCTDQHTCRVAGVLDWEASGSNGHSAGVATFAMTFHDGQIDGETGSVVSRN